MAFPLLATAQVTDESQLTGTIFDAQGSVIAGAKIKAVDATGKTYETISNGEGDYVLKLLFRKYDNKCTNKCRSSRYDISAQSPGFEITRINGYIFIPSQFGKMRMDIALETLPPTDHNYFGPELIVIN